MKTRILLYLGMFFVGSVLLLGSCKKNASVTDATDILRSRTAAWREQFSKTASEEGKIAVNQLFSQLNYNNGAVIVIPGNQTMYVIGTTASTGRSQFLTLAETSSGIQAAGVYDAQSLQQLTQFLQTRKLPTGEKLTAYSLQGHPLVQ